MVVPARAPMQWQFPTLLIFISQDLLVCSDALQSRLRLTRFTTGPTPAITPLLLVTLNTYSTDSKALPGSKSRSRNPSRDDGCQALKQLV